MFQALDWHALGEIYCDEGGDAFWAAHRGRALTLGLRWAEALTRRLSGAGASLWVGAGVAEIPALCAERRMAGRRIVACNLREHECEVLNDGLRVLDGSWPKVQIEPCAASARVDRGPFDHLALVSVLSDPETWPVASAIGYGRLPPALIDTAELAREQAAIRALSRELLGALTADAWIATTGEEAPWLLQVAAELGIDLAADDESIETALVGDPIGFLRATRGSTT